MAISQGYGVAGGGGLRASDADRERAVEVLKAGYAEGRMPKDEYDARVGQAYTVPTRADLELVTAQLPGGGPVLYATGGRRLNQLAVASLACGVGQPFTVGLSTIPAIVLGHVAHRQIRRTGEDGKGLATAGIVLGWIGAALIALVITLIVIAAIALAHAAPGTG